MQIRIEFVSSPDIPYKRNGSFAMQVWGITGLSHKKEFL